jgi:ComF family protein
VNGATAPLRSLAATLLDLVLPRFCLGCGAGLGDRRASLLLCSICRGRLARCETARVCSRCVRPLPRGIAERPICLACLDRPPPFVRLTAVWWYQAPLDSVLRALKFGRLDFLAEALIEEASAIVALSGLRSAGCLVPVPLAPLRRLERGFNQADLLARELGRRVGLPCRQALSRPGFRSPPQRRRGAIERRRNPGLRFRRRRCGLPAGDSAPIVLVDDIVTTGSTLRAAASALLGAGCGPVRAWVVAATPPADGEGRLALTAFATVPKLGL